MHLTKRYFGLELFSNFNKQPLQMEDINIPPCFHVTMNIFNAALIGIFSKFKDRHLPENKVHLPLF
jgi:hypothetical protein